MRSIDAAKSEGCGDVQCLKKEQCHRLEVSECWPVVVPKKVVPNSIDLASRDPRRNQV